MTDAVRNGLDSREGGQTIMKDCVSLPKKVPALLSGQGWRATRKQVNAGTICWKAFLDKMLEDAMSKSVEAMILIV